jgi:hypothetical protein
MKSLRGAPSSNTFSSGRPVPRSGIYKTCHEHPVQHEIPLLIDHIFPSCPKCNVPVKFTFVSGLLIESASTRFRLLMHTPQPLSTARRENVK